MKTIADLNHKVWYRLLKVVYIMLFLISALLIIYLNFTKIDTYVNDYLVTCRYGNNKSFLAFNDLNINEYEIRNISTYNLEKIKRKCKIKSEDIRNIVQEIRSSNPDYINRINIRLYGSQSEKDTLMEKENREITSKIIDFSGGYLDDLAYKKIILYTFVYLYILSLFFRLIKVIFYYIVLGKIKPNK